MPILFIVVTVGALRWWLFLWAIWDHPLFWPILIAMVFLAIIAAVVEHAARVDP